MGRLFVLAVCIAAPAVLPAQAVPAHPADLQFAPSLFEPPAVSGMRFELRNGLPVYVVPDRSLPLVDIVLALPVGDRNEAPGEEGMVSMTAAMARRGGAGHMGPEELDDAIDALGARVDGSSSWTRTVFVLDIGSKALERGLEILASILFEPRFDEVRLAQARANLRVSLAAREDEAHAVLDREWQRLVHGPASPRSRRLTEASVAAFERDALAAFHRRFWRQEGAVIAASGDVEPERLVARLDELFGSWQALPASQTDADRKAEPSDVSGEPEAVFEAVAVSPGWWTVDRPGSQAAMALGHRGAVFDHWDDRDRWALLLLAEILDGPGAVSRLRSRLQLEEGLTYRVVTWFDLDVVAAEPASERSADHGVGEFRIFLETAPESAAAAAAAVLEELTRLRRATVPEVEIATARRSLLARLPLLFDRAETVAGRFAEDELLGRPHGYWSVYGERLRAVSAADIRRAAQRFIDPEGVVLAVVGDSEAVRAGRAAEDLRRMLGAPRLVETQ
ncbi:MAG: pitrilysin family protein [Acidobacteria bacterium]|nr:pitrilysin family protein [Acidobacteriota bacterium]